MYVYRNRRYEEEIGTLKCHREGEQKMVKTGEHKTQILAHHKIAERVEKSKTII
jgi:hypothetical protein